MPPPPPPRRRVGREMHAFEGELCVFIGSIFTLSILLFALSVSRALHDDQHVNTDDDDGSVHHDRRRSAPTIEEYKVPTEIHTLEALEEAVGEDSAIVQSGWLPLTRRFKRSDVDVHNLQTPSRTSAIHRLHLQPVRKISDDTYYLGTHPHPRDHSIELHSYAFLHKLKNKNAPKTDATFSDIEHSAKHKHFNRTDPLHHHKRKRETIECGAPIADGARWKITKGYYSHPINKGGMPTEAVVLATEAAIDTWRCVFRQLHIEPFGPLLGVVLDEDEKDAVDFSTPTGDNHVAFGTLTLPDGEEDSTLAVTITHGRYGGSIESRYIAEFSTIFNDNYKFADCAALDNTCRRDGSIDYQSIATHELGHSCGLDDLYSEVCSKEPMFWSANPGEIHKRTLTSDAINSIKALYLDE